MHNCNTLQTLLRASWLALLPILCALPGLPSATADPVETPSEPAAEEAAAGIPDLVAQARRDPMLLVQRGRQWYDKYVHEYRCTLVKQERLGGTLGDVQEIELRFRQDPRAVYMLWRANPGGARRALFMESSEFVDSQGRKVARVEPSGAIARLFVKDILIPIHGPDARKTSRRSIDEAGFRATFELLENYNSIAAARGVLDLRYVGTGAIAGRPTHVLKRDLPYEGPNGPYPDARMVLHLDQQWLIPIAIYSYADHEEKTLLGSYVFTDIEINPRFDDNAFRF